MSLFVDYEFKKIFAVEFINHYGFYFYMTQIKPRMTEEPKKSDIIDLSI